MNYSLFYKTVNLIVQTIYFPFVGYFVFVIVSFDYYLYIFLLYKFNNNISVLYIILSKINFINENTIKASNKYKYIVKNKITNKGIDYIISYKSYLINVKMFCLNCYSVFLIIITILNDIKLLK